SADVAVLPIGPRRPQFVNFPFLFPHPLLNQYTLYAHQSQFVKYEFCNAAQQFRYWKKGRISSKIVLTNKNVLPSLERYARTIDLKTGEKF
ncbi:MAG: hypothetical protein RSE23_14755, partial [Clostridia bacterium]